MPQDKEEDKHQENLTPEANDAPDRGKTTAASGAGSSYSTRVGGDVQGGVVNIGGQQTVQGNITITMRDMGQQIQESARGDDSARAELQQQMQQLAQALQKVPPAHEKAAQQVAKRTETLVEEVTSEEPDEEVVGANKNALQKAAENIRDAMPAVVAIVENILKTVAKFYVMGHS